MRYSFTPDGAVEDPHGAFVSLEWFLRISEDNQRYRQAVAYYHEHIYPHPVSGELTLDCEFDPNFINNLLDPEQ